MIRTPFRPRVEALEARLVLSLSVQAYVNLVDYQPPVDSLTEPISSHARGAVGTADAAATVNWLAVSASNGDGLPNPAAGTASGRWSFRILNVPAGVDVPLTFLVQIDHTVGAASVAEDGGSLGLADFGYDVAAGAGHLHGTETLETWRGAVVDHTVTGQQSSLGLVTDTFSGGGTLTAMVGVSGRATASATATATADFVLVGVSSPLAEQYPTLAVQFDDGRTLPPNLLNDDNVEALATILMSEASVGNQEEQTAVGWTVRNRMIRNGTVDVTDVEGAYAHGQPPTDEMRQLARDILGSTGLDPTGGATHYYSPRSMPLEGDDTTGYDVSGGLEQTEGLPRRNYRPGWALDYDFQAVEGVRPAYFKFYRAPGNGPVS